MGYANEYYGNDPTKMAAANRNLALARESQLWDQAQGRIGGMAGTENYYQKLAEQLYDPIVWGGGGYTPEQQQQIAREGELQDLNLTGQDQQRRFLSEDEGNLIWGSQNPDRQREIVDTSARAQRGAVSGAQQAMDTAAGSKDLELARGFQGKLDTIAGDEGLGISDRFSEAYPMSDQEKQDLISSAGMDVRDRYAAAIDSINRKAFAEGSGAPGAGTQRLRFERQAAGQAGDQMIRARMEANTEAARRQQVMEGMRLNAAQSQAGMKMGAAETGEQMRLNSAQDIASRKAEAGYRGGLMQQQTEQGIGEEALKNEQDIRNYTGDTARFMATNRQATEVGNQQENYTRRLNQNELLSKRYTDIANQQKAEQKEGRQFATGEQQWAGEQRNQAVGQQIQGEQTTSGAAAQGAETNMREKVAKLSKPGILGSIIGAGLGAAGGFLTQGPAGGAAGAFKGAAGGWNASQKGFAEGGVVTKPTIAKLGERGPEMVVPLTKQPNQRVSGGYASFAANQPQRPMQAQAQPQSQPAAQGSSFGAAPAQPGRYRSPFDAAPAQPAQQGNPARAMGQVRQMQAAQQPEADVKSAGGGSQNNPGWFDALQTAVQPYQNNGGGIVPPQFIQQPQQAQPPQQAQYGELQRLREQAQAQQTQAQQASQDDAYASFGAPNSAAQQNYGEPPAQPLAPRGERRLARPVQPRRYMESGNYVNSIFRPAAPNFPMQPASGYAAA